MKDVNISDMISIISAAITLIVTCVIAWLQIKQSRRMEDFERRQDKRDEERHEESVKAQAIEFISTNYHDRGLIPLCAMAAMHNELYFYTRKMYRDFCCKTREVQNKILEYCELDLRVVSRENLFGKCMDKVNEILYKYFPEDVSPFYDGGKYVLKSLEDYGNQNIPIEKIKYRPKYMDIEFGKLFSNSFNGFSSYELCITDTLSEAFEQKTKNSHPISKLQKQYHFKESSEIEACQFATILAKYIAIYGYTEKKVEGDYGAPGAYAGETINTMEDLFLVSLFEMYTKLML